MSSEKPKRGPGGVIHTYRRYDPVRFPSPVTGQPPDVVGAAFDHMLQFGEGRHLTPEQLSRAVRIDASQIQGLGPSLDGLLEMLRQRKQKILSTYETDSVLGQARRQYHSLAEHIKPPKRLAKRFAKAVRSEQLRDLEMLWYQVDDQRGQFARMLVLLNARLADLYEVEELAGTYLFTGRTPMTVPEALKIKEELELIDRLIRQLEEARETGQIGLIDLDELAEFAEPGDLDQLGALQQQIRDYLDEMAKRQGLEHGPDGYRLTPQAYKLFQGRVLEEIFSQLQASRTGRHEGPVIGEGAVELQSTKEYEFGDSVTHMDIAGSFINAMIRRGPGLPVQLEAEDILVHRTRNNPKCASCLLLDMSGSMRHGGQYVNAKRMALAMHGLIQREYPGDFLQVFEMATFARPRRPNEIVHMMPKPVMIYDPVVRLRVDMSDPDVLEAQVPPHFTNIQHALRLARQMLGGQDTPNRQIVLITDGLPTAHFEDSQLYLLYPPDPRTEEATMREALLCAREQITINIFLLPSWSQTREDIQFAYELAEATRGRVFFTAGKDLDRYVVWDYLRRRREIIA